MEQAYPNKKIELDENLFANIKHMQDVVNRLNVQRRRGLSDDLKKKVYSSLKVSQVYNSNAIEGNKLSLRETELIVNGLRVNNRLLKDEVEAKTLSDAFDFLYDLVNGQEVLSRRSTLELHSILMKGIQGINRGKFRMEDVTIQNSNHTPPSWAEVPDFIDEMFSWFDQSSAYPVIKACILHHWFTWIHPFEDGNGRVGRLLLNFALMQSGYPEVVVKLTDRDRYYDSLISADQGDIRPLIELVSDRLLETVDLYEEYLNEEKIQKAWLNKYSETALTKKLETIGYDYEVWKSAMEIFKARFKQTVSQINEILPNVNFSFREYEIIDKNKYIAILENQRVSNTWFFTVGMHDFKTNLKLVVIFYFDRFFSKSRRRYKSKPSIKLYASLRKSGETLSLPESIDFMNVDIKGDKMMIGVRSTDNRRYIENIETSKAMPVIRKFIDQIIEEYLIE